MRHYTKRIAAFLFCLLLIGCRQTVDKYGGGIVYEKGIGAYKFLTIRNGDRVKRVYVYDIDYQKYQVGDTLPAKRPDALTILRITTFK